MNIGQAIEQALGFIADNVPNGKGTAAYRDLAAAKNAISDAIPRSARFLFMTEIVAEDYRDV